MSCMRAYILITDRELSGCGSILCGKRRLTCLAVTNPTGNTIKIGSRWISLPEEHQQALLLETDNEWQTLPFQRGESGILKLFVTYGQTQGPVGLRTCLDWEKTYWGIELSKSTGIWLIPCYLPNVEVEFKTVQGHQEGDMFDWEPPPYRNKRVHLKEDLQVVVGCWGTDTVDTEAIPYHKKAIQIDVKVPREIDYQLNSVKPFGYHLVIRDCRDEHNSPIFNAGHQAELFYANDTKTYRTKMMVPRILEEVRFKVVLVDNQNVITHLDRICFTNEGVNYRSVNLEDDSVINCDYFVDIRPVDWSMGNVATLSTCESHVYDLYDLLTEVVKPKYTVQVKGLQTATKMGPENFGLYKELLQIVSANMRTGNDYGRLY